MIKKLLTLTLLFSTLFLCAQEWEQLDNVPFEAHHSNGFGIGDKAYILKGAHDAAPNYYSNEFWEYSPENDNWNQLSDFPGAARHIAIGDDWNGKYYYGFGSNDQGAMTDIWEFDPATGEFTELPSCPCVGRTHPAFVAHNDKIFMGSGSTSNGDLEDWWVYDMITQEWSQKDDIPGNDRHHPFQFGIDGYIYVGGGHETNWSAYNIATEEWSAIDNYPEGRVAGTQFSYGGKGYTLSGDNRFHEALMPGDYFLEYDPALDEWEVLPSHPGSNRWACSSFIINGYVYLFGGYTSGDDGRMWRYQLEEIIEEPSSTEEIASANQNISISPNPFTDEIAINFKLGRPMSYQVEVFNLLGERVYTKKMSGNETLNMTSLTAGVYILSVNVDDMTMSQRVVKH